MIIVSSTFKNRSNCFFSTSPGRTRKCSQLIGFPGTKPDKLTYEPARDKLYNKTGATSKDSDQTAHLRSLIRVFADRMYLPKPRIIERGINENLAILG